MCATFAARTPDTGNITGRVLAHPFTDSAGVLLLTTPARSPPLTLEAAGVSLWSFPPQFWFAGPPAGLAGKGMYLLCWVFGCQGAGERTISAKEKNAGEWSVPLCDLLRFQLRHISVSTMKFQNLLGMALHRFLGPCLFLFHREDRTST